MIDSISYAEWLCGLYMVEFKLDEMQEMLRELAHQFAVDEVRPNAEHWDANSEYPIDAIKAAHEMGILNLHISEDYGGPGLGIMEEVLVNEELAWGDPGFALGGRMGTMSLGN